MQRGVTSPAFLITSQLIIFGLLVLGWESGSFFGALFFAPFAFGPLIVSLLLAAICPYRACQIALITGTVLYAVWFVSVWLSAFQWHVDAQSSISLLFAGVYSLPVMIPVWIVTLVLRHREWKASLL
jgi:hypothetical protein